MKEVVTSGRTVDEAKQNAFRELGVKSEHDVEIEIIDEGSKGVFGWGTKFARVKVRLLKEYETEKSEKQEIVVKVKSEQKKKNDSKKSQPSKVSETRKSEVKKIESKITEVKRFGRERAEMPPITVGERPLPLPPQVTTGTDIKEEEYFEKDTKITKVVKEDYEEAVELLEDEEGSGPFSPREILMNVLKYMKVDGEIKIKSLSGVPIYSIEGKDLGILIGKHGQTLESLQFLVNLILLRKTDNKKKITIDVEGYRSRREKSLQDLAKRLADKSKREKRNIVLEPMLPSERRIIHLTLQNNPNVSTFSQGEEPMRKVIIAPKKRGGRKPRSS